MATDDKLRECIAEIISRPKSVDYEEIKWVMDQLGAVMRTTKHSNMFKIPGCKFPLMLNKHNNGKKHLPPYCVRDFCDRMTELGHYGQDGSHENS